MDALKLQARRLGFDVLVHFTNGSTKNFRNVTEIHYAHAPEHKSVAFESDIHGTGTNWPIAEIKEFEALPSVERAQDYE